MLDQKMSYFDTLKATIRGLIQWPITMDEILSLRDAIVEIAWCLLIPAFRLAALILLPISAPLISVAVQYVRRSQSRRAEARRKSQVKSYFCQTQKHDQ